MRDRLKNRMVVIKGATADNLRPKNPGSYRWISQALLFWHYTTIFTVCVVLFVNWSSCVKLVDCSFKMWTTLSLFVEFPIPVISATHWSTTIRSFEIFSITTCFLVRLKVKKLWSLLHCDACYSVSFTESQISFSMKSDSIKMTAKAHWAATLFPKQHHWEAASRNRPTDTASWQTQSVTPDIAVSPCFSIVPSVTSQQLFSQNKSQIIKGFNYAEGIS